MRVCVVSEGSYPYSVGGVSGWIHNLIRAFPNLEFVLVNIVSNREQRGKFAYELPEHVSEVYEVYLQDQDWSLKRRHKKSRMKLKDVERRALRSLMLNQGVEWDILFELFQNKEISVDALLMGEDFFRIAVEVYEERYTQIMFSDFLWTLRSMYVPLFLVMQQELPQADAYHCVATGYAGVIGCMAQHTFGSKVLLSEHGIYTREREEEIIRATWLDGLYKDIWIEQFHKMSRLIYERADIVTSLYPEARQLQIQLRCPEDKTLVVPNGIDIERFENLPGKAPEEQNMIYVGAVLRVTQIKDVKTMLYAFAEAKKRVPNLKLWVMGSMSEEPEYAQECVTLAGLLAGESIEFTGTVDVREYLGRMDFTLLTSISEGQPLTVLESYAAGKPVIATDVGDCRGLIYGEGRDTYGAAGILVHIMNQEEITSAIIELALDPEKRREMGERGYKRVKAFHELAGMQRTYRDIYKKFADEKSLDWPEENFKIEKELVQSGNVR